MKLVEVSIARPIFITMVAAFLVVVGALALRRLPVDLYPDVSYPVLSVRTDLPGASPEEVEQLITRRTEDTLAGLAGLTNMRSISREGSGIVTLEFAAGTDVKFQEMQVRAKVSNLKRSLPEETLEPVVQRQDPDESPIIDIAVTGNRTVSELSHMAEYDVAEKIRQIAGVGTVALNGERSREIAVELRPEKLEAARISARDVVQAVSEFIGNEPIGKVSGTRRSWLVRSVSHVRSVEDLRHIPIAKASTAGVPVYLGDLADVRDSFAEVRRVARFHTDGALQPSVVIEVAKQSGENAVAVSDRIHAAIVQMQEKLPGDIRLIMTRDNAELVRQNVADVAESLIIGAILTIAVVLLFLRSPRATLTTGLALPSSIITTFAIMFAAGFTINIMTLLALSLAVGLLVDDAIVVRENIFRHFRESPHVSPQENAARGAREVSLAVVATTLTLVAVFLPVGFMGGTSGQFFRQFAVTVVFAMLVSLWDALTMAPMLSAHYANIADPSVEWRAFGRAGRGIDRMLIAFEGMFIRLEHAYSRLLKTLIRRAWMATVVGLAALVGAVAGFRIIPKSFLPAQLGQSFSVSLNGPIGVPIDRVVEDGGEADRRLQTVDGLEYWTLSSGLGFVGNASINITPRIKAEAAKNQEQLAKVRADVRRALGDMLGYSLRLSEPADPLAGSTARFQPVAVIISGPELPKLRMIAGDVQNAMRQVDGITDLVPLTDEGLPELRLVMDPQRAGYFGTTLKALGTELRTLIQGDTSNALQAGGERVPIRIKLKDGDKLSPSSIAARTLLVRPAGTSGPALGIPVSGTVRTEAGAGAALIARENRQKIMRVGGGLARGAALGDVATHLEEKLSEIVLPTGYSLRIVGQNEQMGELFRNVLVALALGCLFMYMILASLFESFTQPLTVMVAVPLAATGAVLALLIFSMPLDLYGGIGIILLAGIVAKNSILLVDFAMQKIRDHAADPAEAILSSAPQRLRPILMTSAAMVVGMIPVAAGLGAGGAARQALGVATIGGVLSSTILTLIVVPNVFVLMERMRQRVVGRFRRRPVGTGIGGQEKALS